MKNELRSEQTDPISFGEAVKYSRYGLGLGIRHFWIPVPARLFTVQASYLSPLSLSALTCDRNTCLKSLGEFKETTFVSNSPQCLVQSKFSIKNNDNYSHFQVKNQVKNQRDLDDKEINTVSCNELKFLSWKKIDSRAIFEYRMGCHMDSLKNVLYS